MPTQAGVHGIAVGRQSQGRAVSGQSQGREVGGQSYWWFRVWNLGGYHFR